MEPCASHIEVPGKVLLKQSRIASCRIFSDLESLDIPFA